MRYYAMLIKRLDFYATMTAHQNKVILNLDGISLRSYCGLARHVLHVQAKKKTLSTFSFMESLGTIVNFFSKKVKEKVDLIRELSLRATAKDYEKDHLPSQSLGLKNDVSVTESHPVELKVSKLQLIFPNLS